MAPLFRATGKCSHFGGPNDSGVSPSEGLAFIYEYDERPDLFLKEQPPGTTGLARRLNPAVHYVACRWDYDVTPKTMLADERYLAKIIAKGMHVYAHPADWGPHEEKTGRAADLSPALMNTLELETDDEVTVEYPVELRKVSNMKFAISSGHGTKIQGADSLINEVEEATRVVNTVANLLDELDFDVVAGHDIYSDDQSENLNRIVDWHNKQTRDLDVSIHFNAFEKTDGPRGTEVCYVSQEDLAARVSAAIAKAGGFIDRGAKRRTDLFFLNNTEAPAILIEVCFVDSKADVDLYQKHYDAICLAIAESISDEGPDVA